MGDTLMPAGALVELLDILHAAHIPAWLDGGWGVDALVGKQSRSHKDVDLIVPVSDVPALLELLAPRHFAIKEGSPPDSFVLADLSGLEIDVHAVFFDQAGNGLYRMQNGEIWVYPEEGFVGRGSVEGRSVQCLSPSVQVLCHAHGYEPTEKDFEDMRLLEAHFGIELPPQLKPENQPTQPRDRIGAA